MRVRLKMGYITINGDTVCGRNDDKELDLGVPSGNLLHSELENHNFSVR